MYIPKDIFVATINQMTLFMRLWYLMHYLNMYVELSTGARDQPSPTYLQCGYEPSML